MVFIKWFLEILNLLCNNRFAFYLAKKMKLFDAVFITYPATQMFADYYTFRFRQKRIMWNPWITGLIRHPSGKVTLQMAISANEADIVSTSNANELRELYQKTLHIQESVGAISNHFAGIIPGCLTHLRVSRQKNELEATVKNVVNAISFIRDSQNHSTESPVIILGSKGYIGRNVTEKLRKAGIHVVGVDLGDSFLKPTIPYTIVNITRPEAVNEYVDTAYMGDRGILLNEVYPAPHESIVSEMKSLGMKVFHIAGVNARCNPSFPGPYKNALPCCAALPLEDYKIEVVEL